MKTLAPQKLLARWTGEKARCNELGCDRPPILTGVVFGLVIFSRGAFAQLQPDLSTPGDLKKLSVEELMDIDVTLVSREPEKLLDAPSAIQVVTQDDIHRSGASSIPEALRLADNLEVAQQNSHTWNISARGFNTDLANKLLVMIDGRTVYTPLFSGVFWDLQDYLLEDIDQIEVVSGPGGTLWGANAVNGVINITSKSAKDTQGSYVETGGGTELRDFAGVRYGGTFAPNVYFRVYGKYSDYGSEVLPNGNEASDSWNLTQGGFRIDDEAFAQNQLTLQGDTYTGNENIPTGGREKVEGGNVLGRWSHTFSDDSNASLQLYYDETHLANPEPKTAFLPAGILTDDLDTYDLDFQHHFAWGDYNKIVWGLGYRYTGDVVGPAPTLAFLPAHLDQNLYSGFFQDEIKLRENLFFTLGSKLEKNAYTGWEKEPSGRLQLNLTPKQMVWAAVSRAVRTPSRIDRDLVEPTGLPKPFPQSILDGGPGFTSETVIAYELGYRAQLGSKVTTSLSLYYNDYDHVRSTTPGPPGFPTLGFPLVFQNNLEGHTYGAEFSTSYQVLDWWRLHGGYDLLEEHMRVKPGEVDFSDGLNETADPRNQFSLRSSMDLPQSLDLDTDLRWVDRLHNNNGPIAGSVPSYFELDARLGWNPTEQLEFSIVGQNLLHNHHPEYGFPSPTREEIERSVYGKVAWRY
jgi:iron complex outermembrane receptor protein